MVNTMRGILTLRAPFVMVHDSVRTLCVPFARYAPFVILSEAKNLSPLLPQRTGDPSLTLRMTTEEHHENEGDIRSTKGASGQAGGAW
jgi:hypothetical protein